MLGCARCACHRRVMKACGKLLTRFCRGSIAGLREMSRRRKRGRWCGEFLRISWRFRWSRLPASPDSSRTWEQGEKLQAVQDLQMRRARQLSDDGKITPGGAAILHQQLPPRQCLARLRTLNER